LTDEALIAAPVLVFADQVAFLLPLLGRASTSSWGIKPCSPQVVRLELAGTGITLSVVHPSITAAEFHERLRADRQRLHIPVEPTIPHGRS